jgi:5-methylcytosine-specific restriction protein A
MTGVKPMGDGAHFEVKASSADIGREKEKARALRKTQWWQRQIAKEICHYCRRPTARTELTMDHIVPLARGGRSSRGNLVPACKTCNNRKKYLLPIEWDEYLKNCLRQESQQKPIDCIKENRHERM